jgi:hypothetical protein
MILIVVFILISVVTLISVRRISAGRGFWKSVWWVSGGLSLFRIACLWAGYFLIKTEGTGQVFGYFMVLGTVPEALLVSQIREQPTLWASMLSLLIPVASFLWVFFLGCIAARKSQYKSLL